MGAAARFLYFAGNPMKKCPICDRSFEDQLNFCEFDGSILQGKQHIRDPYLGRILRDRYKIIEKIEHGSVSDVYFAEQVLIGRKVLLKIVRPEHTSDEAFVKRFRQEAKLISSLNHPRIIQLFDFDQDADGSFFIITEYVQGKSLKQIVQAGGLRIPRALRLAIQIAEGLGAAHAAGVIHRDINPRNIIVTNDQDDIKITDFGFARSREFEATVRLTQSGMVLGDPYYTAPEQIEGSNTDERTDIYSLGIILYEMLCGVVPFRASTPTGVWMQHLNELPIPPTNLRQEISLQVEEIVLRALQKKPEQRWARMSEVSEALSKAEHDFARSPTAENVTVTRPLVHTPIALPDVQLIAKKEPINGSEKQPALKDVAQKTVVLENFDAASLDFKSSESTATDSVSKTMVLTQALEVVHRKKLNWTWLGIGGAIVMASVFILWPVLFRESHRTQLKTIEPPAAGVTEPSSPRPSQLSSISIDAEKLKLAVGEPTALRLTGRYDDGSIKTVEADAIDWRSSNPTVASADSRGKITAKKVGTTKFTTRYMGLETSPIAIVVVGKRVSDETKPAALVIRASRQEMTVRERLRLRVTGKYADGREDELKTGIRWESSAPEVASVDAKGAVSAQTAGQAQLTARYGEIVSEPLNLLIKPSLALAKSPSTAPAIDRPMKTTLVEDRIKIARAHMDGGDYTEALSELDKASKIDPNSKDVQTALSDTKRACNAEKTLGRADLKC